jgi:hypothetical protein
MSVLRVLASTCILVVCGSYVADAATITLFDRATFQTAVAGGTISQQNFEGFADLTLLTTDGVVTYAASGGHLS